MSIQPPPPTGDPVPSTPPVQEPVWRRYPWITGVVIVVVMIVGWSLFENVINRKPATASLQTVLYEVEGTAPGVNITVTTPTGITQANGKAVPLRRGGSPGLQYMFPAGAFVSISAQNVESYGDLLCRITVNGRVVSENRASGGYAIASCDGTA